VRAQTVARIYAETLLRVADRGEAVEAVDEGVGVLAATLREDSAFARFLAAPQISSEEKRALIERALGERLPPVLVRFLGLLVEKRRESLLAEIAVAWRELLDERANRTTATLVSAAEIDDETREAIRAALEKSTGKSVVLEHEIEPAMIGGVILRFGDTVVDGSVRRRLGEIRNRLRRAHVASSDA